MIPIGGAHPGAITKSIACSNYYAKSTAVHLMYNALETVIYCDERSITERKRPK
jgi:hypothetical protein